MTMPAIAPVRDQSELTRVSRCLLHFRASDLLNKAVGGQDATFSRGTTATITDPGGAVFTCGYTHPTWETQTWQGADRVAYLRMGSSDRFHFACGWRPQALGFYHEFRQSGSMAANGVTLWSVANDAVTGARLRCYSNGTIYAVEHHNGTTSVAVGMSAAPVANDSVILWGYLYADGSLQMFQSINGTLSQTGVTSTNTMAASWGSTPRVRLSANGTTAGVPAYHKVFKLVPGLPSLAQMVRAF